MRKHNWSCTAMKALMPVMLLAACSPVPEPEAAYDPAALRFSGERALEFETIFVTQFPNRDSGKPNNRRAAEWLQQVFTRLGWTCRMDEWQVVNYSRPVPLNNVVCELPGESGREILVAAHHDQSPDTVQGADNDGSGIAILINLAEIFAAEGRPRHTLVFLVADAEEYGMLGVRRYLETHPDPDRIAAGLSLDNLGKDFYDGLDMDARGQFRGYGQLWLLRAAQESARAAGELWVPRMASPVDQVLGQAVPISFMDEGPMVAAGVPAFGFAGHVPPEAAELHWQTYHSPEDTLEHQSVDALYQSGQAAEALLRQLLAMESFPREPGPYLYLESSGMVLRGAPLWAIFAGFVGLFLLGGALIGGRLSRSKLGAWRQELPHYLGLWLPLLASIVLLYVFVAVGLMDRYELYPATSKDEPLFQPRWPAVILWAIGLAVFLWVGRRLSRRGGPNPPTPFPEGEKRAERAGPRGQTKSLALFIVGLGGVYVSAVNPFSLLFMVPLVFWFLIGGRRGAGRALDIVLFVLGGLVVYVLFYFFGFVILRNDFAIMWYLMMMFSIGMISFPTAAAITAIIGAGLSMVVHPPRRL